jgi:hypothetical protein
MLRRDRLSSLTSSVESALLNPTPLLTQGQVTALVATRGDQGRPAFSSAREYHQWRKARGREAKECLRPLIERGVLGTCVVRNYFHEQIVQPTCLYAWSPGAVDPDPAAVSTAISEHLVRAASESHRALTTYYIPRHVARPALGVRLYAEPLWVVEETPEVVRDGQPVVALRVASLYLSILAADPAAAATWELNPDYRFESGGPITPEAFVTRNRMRVALRTSLRWPKPTFEAFHSAMKKAGQAYEIW